jgi:hypothetical protein
MHLNGDYMSSAGINGARKSGTVRRVRVASPHGIRKTPVIWALPAFL